MLVLRPPPGIVSFAAALVVDHLDVEQIEDEDDGVEDVDDRRLDAVGQHEAVGGHRAQPLADGDVDRLPVDVAPAINHEDEQDRHDHVEAEAGVVAAALNFDRQEIGDLAVDDDLPQVANLKLLDDGVDG